MATTLETTAGTLPNEQYLAAFDRLLTASAPWATSLRKAGLAHFAETGFPTLSHEEWRFTSVSPIARLPFALAAELPTIPFSKTDLQKQLFADAAPAGLLVFVNGLFSQELSSMPKLAGVTLETLASAAGQKDSPIARCLGRYARNDENPFVALNTAFFQDGLLISVAADTVVESPIYLCFVSTSSRASIASHPRVFVHVEKKSEVKIIEHYISAPGAAGLTNAVTELLLEEEARAEHCKVQQESAAVFHIATIQAHQGRSSHLISHSISTGAAIARNNLNIVLNGENCEATLNGLYLGQGEQLVDHHTAIHHAKAHCNSHEFYNGILDDHSQGVFNGKIFVRPEAQKTDAKQTNRNLLLSDEAVIHTKPQLEIFADDVKCTHGATVGQLEQEAIFYLRSRGIPLEMARKMLIHAFASDIVNRITIDPIRTRLDELLFDLYEK